MNINLYLLNQCKLNWTTPYYPDRNKGIDHFVTSIIVIVTGMYDSRWRVFLRLRLSANDRINILNKYFFYFFFLFSLYFTICQAGHSVNFSKKYDERLYVMFRTLTRKGCIRSSHKFVPTFVYTFHVSIYKHTTIRDQCAWRMGRSCTTRGGLHFFMKLKDM